MTKHKDLEFMFIQMEQNIKDNGKMINSMEQANNFGKMAQNTKDNIKRVKNKEKEFLLGLILLYIKELLEIIK